MIFLQALDLNPFAFATNGITVIGPKVEAITVNTSMLAAFGLCAISCVAPVVAQTEEPAKVYLEADVLIDDQSNSLLIAEGDVVARYEGRELSADRVVYNLTTQKVRATGNVRIIDPDGTVRFADDIEVDENLSDGVATEFVAQLPQDAVVVARTASRSADGSNSLDQVIYTACEICEEGGTPTWTLRARRAVQDAETQMISYQDAVFELLGVPVIYLPYFAHPDPTTDRRSGFLAPTPGLSSKLGFVYEQPYYWAISDSQDLTITPKLYTKVNSALELDYRKRFYSGFIEANISVARDFEFDSDGERLFYNSANYRVVRDTENFPFPDALEPSPTSWRSHIFAEGKFAINENWDWGFAWERTTDDLYLRRYDISDVFNDRGLLDVDGLRLVSQIYAVGQTKNFYADVASYTVQSFQANERDAELGVVTPLLYANRIFDFGNIGLVTLEGSSAVINRDDGDDTRRVSAEASWKNSYVAPAGLVIEPEVDIRADYYDFTLNTGDPALFLADTQTRTTGTFAATARWPLARYGRSSNMTIEPIVMVAHTETSLENSLLPNEDSSFYELDLSMAFEADPFTNYDLVETGTRIAAGARATADFNNGFRVEGEVARRWRSEADPAFSPGSNLAGEKSDYLIGTALSYKDTIEFATRLRVDEQGNVNRIETSGSFDYWRLSTDFTYFSLSEDISFDLLNPVPVKGALFNADLRVTDNITAFYSLRRNVEEDFNAIQSFGFEIFDDCSFFRISMVEVGTNDRGVGGDESIRFEFGFKTLGEISDRNVD